MEVVLIGAGNVATVLGKRILAAGHRIVQVMSRQASNAAALADLLGATAVNDNNPLYREADVYLIAVSDSAMSQLDKQVWLGDKLVLHTAGAVSIDVLQHLSSRYGVLYPLQSLRKEMMDAELAIPLLIEGNNENVLEDIRSFAATISNSVQAIGEEDRFKLHVAAVMVNNFTNHLYALASAFCQKEHLDFQLLHPMILETANRLLQHDPGEMQTGPAIRKDISTLEKHLRLLANHPKQHHIYLKMTDSIMNP